MSTTVTDAYRLLVADVYELAGLSRSSSEQIARRYGRTAAQGHVLSVLTGGEQTVSAIARRLGLSRQAVQRVVHDLAADGQVRVRPNPADARSPLVGLSAAGRRTMTRLFADSDAHRHRLLARAGVRAGDLESARRTVRQLLDALAHDA